MDDPGIMRQELMCKHHFAQAVRSSIDAGFQQVPGVELPREDSVCHRGIWAALKSLSQEGCMRLPPMRCVMIVAALVCGCHHLSTPAGYVGYVFKEPIAIGQDTFFTMQDGPTSTGLGWPLRRLKV
jgi:hypothetical protein